MVDYIDKPTNKGGLAIDWPPWKGFFFLNAFSSVVELIDLVVCNETEEGLEPLEVLERGDMSYWKYRLAQFATPAEPTGLGGYMADMRPKATAAFKRHFDRTPNDIPGANNMFDSPENLEAAFNMALYRYHKIVKAPDDDHPMLVFKPYDPNVPDYPGT